MLQFTAMLQALDRARALQDHHSLSLESLVVTYISGFIEPVSRDSVAQPQG
jgi:hypothetical protein